MRAVDTNFLVRLATGDDPVQTRAGENFIAGGGWVSLLVLAEAVWVLQSVYDRKATQVYSAIELFLDNPALTLQDPDVVLAALQHFRARPAIKFSDCLILEIARKAGHMPVGTFDKDFAKLPGAERIVT